MNKLICILLLFVTTGIFADQVVVLPERFKDKKIVTVNSQEFNELVKKNNLEKQLKEELKNWELYSKELDRKIQEEYKINNQMIQEIERLKEVKAKVDKQLVEKDLAILQRNVTIAGLILLMGIYAYLKFILHIPFL